MAELKSSSSAQFVGLFVLVCWLGTAAVLAALYADQRFVSVPQLIAADAVAEVRVERLDASTGLRGEVVNVYKGDLTRGEKIVIEGVTESALTAVRPDQVWIVPLTRAGDAYQVTRYPLRAPVRIYRALPHVRRQIAWALHQEHPGER